MAKKTNRISVNAIEKIMKETYVPTETVEWNGVEIVITKTLDMDNMLSFVDSVVRSCFADGTNEYIPEARDFAIRVNVMRRYADIALPGKVESQYEVAMCSGVFEMITEHINHAQFAEILRSIDQKIHNMASANVSMLQSKFNDISDSFAQLVERVDGVFGDVSNEDFQNLAKAIAESGKLTEDGIVKAYLANTKGAE